MKLTQFEIGDLLSVLLSASFVVYVAWAFSRRRRRKSDTVGDGPLDEAYRVYTTEYDLTLLARDVPRVLREQSPDRFYGWALRNVDIWERKIASATALVDKFVSDAAPADRLRQAFASTSSVDWAICLLIDHSGSMRDDRILHVAAATRWLSRCLGEVGTQLAVLGFSTVGWQGGNAYQRWLASGRPKRPGRLCALLHIHFAGFDTPLATEDWQVMLHPDVLRENVDGEAILWATQTLLARPEPRKLLIIISDGAPVDDATLTHNGLGYLGRHQQLVVRQIAKEKQIILAGMGIGYQVSEFYERSAYVATLSELPDRLSSLIADIVA